MAWLRNHSKIQLLFYHLNTEHVCYSDPHCVWIHLSPQSWSLFKTDLVLLQGATPRRSPRKRFVLTPSSESKSLQSTEVSNLTPGKGPTWYPSLQADHLTPGKDFSEKRKKFKNKKELFKSCGLEDSCSNSNFATQASVAAEKPVLTGLPSQKPITTGLAQENEKNLDTR